MVSRYGEPASGSSRKTSPPDRDGSRRDDEPTVSQVQGKAIGRNRWPCAASHRSEECRTPRRVRRGSPDDPGAVLRVSRVRILRRGSKIPNGAKWLNDRPLRKRPRRKTPRRKHSGALGVPPIPRRRIAPGKQTRNTPAGRDGSATSVA